MGPSGNAQQGYYSRVSSRAHTAPPPPRVNTKLTLPPFVYSPLIARYDLHKGPVRGLDFNSHQTNLLASGATNGEVSFPTPLRPLRVVTG